MNARDGFTLEWSDALSVGDYSIDCQHQKLLHICRTCEKLQCDSSREGIELFHEQLHEMQGYSNVHFASEEGLLARIGYPGLDEQHQEHLKYQEDLSELLFEAVIGDLPAAKVVRFLSEWWVSHILTSDMEYVPYLKTCTHIIRRDFLRSDAVLDSDHCRRIAA